MSRIGKLPIEVPAGVTVDIKDNIITVKGPKGELKQTLNPNIKVEIENNEIKVSRPNDERENRAQHGLYRALIHNMVVGVSTGFKKEMEIVGVGYRATSQGQVLELALGYSHAIYLKMPPEVKVEAKICAKIRSFRKPEPYKGKGVKFVGEIIRRKSGKTAAAK